jgi:hypothetical protein
VASNSPKTSQMFILVVFFSIFLSIGGCSSHLVVMKPSCSEMNWFEKGRQDGMQGQPSNNWIMHTKECAKMQQAEIQNYLDGWNHGLSMYCTERHGYVMARTGTTYQKTCPEKYEEDFMVGYQQGLKIYLIEKETSQINAQLETMQQQLKDAKISLDDREKLRREIAALSEKKTGHLKTLEKYNKSFSR